MLTQPVSVIAFDLDDTLWPCMPTIRRAENATYAWLQQYYPRVTDAYTPDALFEFRKAFMRRNETYQIDLSLMRKAMLTELAETFDYDPELMAKEGFALFYELRHEVDFFDDVFPVLEQLKTRFRLGSISNGNASAGRTPLTHYFDFFINAGDIMAKKPDRDIFDAFCESLSVSASECLYVGDHPVHDVVGAREAGMQTVWINRDTQDWPAEIEPAQAQIQTLHELLDLLD